MKVIVDTSVWSLALRRGDQKDSLHVRELRDLIQEYRVQMLGPIRQEILSGIRHPSQFNRLKDRLDSFPDFPILAEDYVSAARFFNLCRSKGIQGSNTDFLICAVAVRTKFPIYTTDKDFDSFSKQIPILLYEPRESQRSHED